jgi:phospholipid/cholesterol/gamma-HCH transport system substrate-binding protein
MSERRNSRRLPSWALGLIVVAIIAFGFYVAFSKHLPFASRGYEIKAVFHDAQNVAVNSPVREAGVNVGTVTAVDPLPQSNAAVVTMAINDNGRPIHSDARLQLRPRLFLEGNLFVDVHPGSPSAPEVPANGEIPIQQTANSVQLDQILTNSLQSNVRGNLQLALKSIGDAFEKYGGAEGLRRIYSGGGPAYVNTALVNQALLGTRVHDLSGLVRNFDLVAAALARNRPQLKSLVTNLRTVTGSFAAQDQALAASIHELPGTLFAARPVFANLNASFPYVRAFAREALPGVRSSDPALAVGTPWIYQLRKLVSRPELRGLTHDLRPTIPQLARLTRVQIPFMDQARLLSSCFNHVVIPWSNDKVTANDNPQSGKSQIGTVYQETGYGLTGIAGESRSGDPNSQWIRAAVGGGTNTVVLPPAVTGLGEQLVGNTTFPILGSDPPISSSAKTPFKPQVPCETQQPPNLNSGGPGPAPTQMRTGASPSALFGPMAHSQLADLSRKYAQIYMDQMQAQNRQAAGNAIAANNEMASVIGRLRAWNRTDLPLYVKAVQQLTGAPIDQLARLAAIGAGAKP